MGYLLLAIMVSSTFVFTFKVAHLKNWNTDNITLANYIFATVVSVGICTAQGLLPAFLQLPQARLATLAATPSVPGTMVFALGLGCLTGGLYVVNFILTNVNVRNNGAGVSTLFSRCGFLISITVSVLAFGESMTLQRVVGVTLTVLALAIAGGVLGRGSRRFALVKPVLLLGSLLCLGCIDINNKIFSVYALPQYKTNFMAVAFVVALCIYSVLYARRYARRGAVRPRFRWQEVVAGLVMGVPNAFGNIFQILALDTIPASIMFPSLAAGILLVNTVVSALVFKEPFGKRQALAVALTTISLVLVNLPAA